jgi:hypothetical protein
MLEMMSCVTFDPNYVFFRLFQVINPLCQRMDEWNWVMEWQDMLTPAAFVTILEKFFFPKWLQVKTICKSAAKQSTIHSV